ncbi:MAG: STAS domain-containing protein [Terracidiphilus sp.]|jgi:anti-anti-sigma factor
MSSTIISTVAANSNAAEWSAPPAAIERITVTELVRGHDQDLFARLAPVVRRQSMVLDLGIVERIDAAGIAALISLYRCAADAGHRFSVSNASTHVAEVLAIVGLDRILVSQNADRVPNTTLGLQRSAA